MCTMSFIRLFLAFIAVVGWWPSARCLSLAYFLPFLSFLSFFSLDPFQAAFFFLGP